MRGRNGGGERVRSIFSEKERQSPRVCEGACWWGLCVRECAGEGGVYSRNVWGGLVPYGRVQAGSSWRGGGAAAGAGELPCFLSQSQSPESIELEFHIQLKFGCYRWSRLVVRTPLSREVWTRLDSWICSQQDSCPAFQWEDFFAGHCSYHQLCTVEPASWVQLRITAPWLCLLVGQTAVLWHRKFILWLLSQTKECFWVDFLLQTVLAF